MAWLLSLCSLLLPATCLRENTLETLELQRSLDSTSALDLEEENGMAETLEESEESTLFFQTCPRGLEKSYVKGEPVTCLDKSPNPQSPKEPKLALFREPGDPPILHFDRKSESINISLTLGLEFARSIGDEATKASILADFVEEQMSIDPSFKHKYEQWVANLSDTHFKDGYSDLYAHFHGAEYSLYAAIFVIEHAIEHAVVAGALSYVSSLKYHSYKHILYGEPFLYKYTGLKLPTLVKGTYQALHYFEYLFMYPYVIERSLNLVFVKLRDYYNVKEAHSEDFVNRLVLRSTCVKDRLAIQGTENPLSESNIQPNFTQVCKAKQTATLEILLQRTHRAMERVFDVIASVGKCLNMGEDGEPNRKAKNFCIDRMYRELRENRRKPGQLWTALVFMATVMDATDDLLVKPHYGQIMNEKFGVDLSAAASDASHLTAVNDVAEADFETRFVTCWNVVSMHRAFETSLSLVAESLEVWMRTFARRLTAGNSYAVSWWPCQKVFRKLGEEGGFCKKAVWTEEQQTAERISCSSPMNYPQWVCHKRNWWTKRAAQDAMWCKHAGIFEGYEYRYFGKDLTRCGCDCCKRANAYSSLWPELQRGGH